MKKIISAICILLLLLLLSSCSTPNSNGTGADYSEIVRDDTSYSTSNSKATGRITAKNAFKTIADSEGYIYGLCDESWTILRIDSSTNELYATKLRDDDNYSFDKDRLFNLKALVFYEVIDETTMQILPFGTCTLKYAAKKDNYCIFSTQNAGEDDFDLEDYLIFMTKSTFDTVINSSNGTLYGKVNSFDELVSYMNNNS